MNIQELVIENVVVGSGAAGFRAALALKQNGETDLALITENVKAGTSRNTGSDKQTYYKLSLASGDQDSVLTMAEDLFSGGCVDGDQALCEAALSARGFLSLAELGVPFPYTEYGEYMGYKTDHDRGRRATSAGPYTSRLMTEALERSAEEKGIRILDQLLAIRILKDGNEVRGLLCLDKRTRTAATYVVIWCRNIILATGGPAAMYHDSVYPESQTGSSGLAFEAGVLGKNLTEWQFGMASLHPRWNVSGTYMQVLPSFISTASDGSDEKEFLTEYFTDEYRMLSMIFLKGYQWPFDVSKIFTGSSVIDLLVYRETVLRGRRVYLDFSRNPGGREIAFDSLSPEAYEYLSKAGACFGTPIERLEKMNEPAISFYKDHGIDLYTQRLEIAVCAQHNNGGLSTDSYWETCVQGLFAIGEVCGSHGVTRPGGTALNAGQVGALRAADRIHQRRLTGEYAPIKRSERLLEEAAEFISEAAVLKGSRRINEVWTECSLQMSASGGMIRNREEMEKALGRVEHLLYSLSSELAPVENCQLAAFYKLRDMLISQKLYLSAMLGYCTCGGGSRGSALYTDKNGRLPEGELPELFRCKCDEGAHSSRVQEALLEESGDVRLSWRDVRPIPQVDYFFENQWRSYRSRMGI